MTATDPTTRIATTDRCTVELIRHSGDDQAVLDAMLVSTGADLDRTPDLDADTGRIRFLMANRHGSPFEHNQMTFRVQAPIAVFREWHRHRIGWSYNEVSGRYSKLEPFFYLPSLDRPMLQVGKPGAYEFEPLPADDAEQVRARMLDSLAASYDQYLQLLTAGAAKEVARGVLPVYVMSSMYATCNARSLMAFLSLRRRKALIGEARYPSFPMWEIDDCAEQAEAHFARLFPITWKAFVDCGRVAP